MKQLFTDALITDVLIPDALEPVPTTADAFSPSRYTGPDVMPAGPVCSFKVDPKYAYALGSNHYARTAAERGPNGRFVGLSDCACEGSIGTIGYRAVPGGLVLCWSCYVKEVRAR